MLGFATALVLLCAQHIIACNVAPGGRLSLTPRLPPLQQDGKMCFRGIMNFPFGLDVATIARF